MLRAAELRHAHHRDQVGACAGNLCAHGVQEVGEVHDLGFTRHIGDARESIREGRGHQQVLGGAHAGEIEGDVGALQAAFGDDIAIFDADLRAERFKSLQVDVHRARANGASAGEADLCLARACEQGAEDEEGGAHAADQVVGRNGVVVVRHGQRHGLAGEVDAHAHFREQLVHGEHVVQAGNIVQHDWLIGEQGGRHQRQRGVLRAPHVNITLERLAATYQYLVQSKFPPGGSALTMSGSRHGLHGPDSP